MESLKEGAKARWGKGSTRGRGKVVYVCVVCACARVCARARSLFCHKLFKGYMLPTTHLGLKVKVEEFLLLLNPLEHVLLILLFSFLLGLTLSCLQKHADRRSLNVSHHLFCFKIKLKKKKFKKLDSYHYLF